MIYKSCMGTHEHVVRKPNVAPYLYPIVDRHVIADYCIGLHKDTITNVTVFADSSRRQNMCECSDACPLANPCIRFDNCAWMNKCVWGVHISPVNFHAPPHRHFACGFLEMALFLSVLLHPISQHGKPNIAFRFATRSSVVATINFARDHVAAYRAYFAKTPRFGKGKLSIH